ncbi:MAG: NifU family protein [Candidatus Margulisiibacteriota bacterium]
MEEKIKASLDKVRPSLQGDGGDVEFVSYKDGIVEVRLTGACGGCPMATMTLKNVVEQMIKEDVPEVTGVESV